MPKFGGKGSPFKRGNKKVLKKGYRYNKRGKPVKAKKRRK